MNWILGGLAVLFLILLLAKKPRKPKEAPNYIDTGCENALKKVKAENAMLKKNVERYKNELGEKQRELIKVTSELRECLANCNQKPNRPPAVLEQIDKEESTPSKTRLSYFEIFQDSDEHYRWRFKAKNNKIVADSGEGYTTKQNLKKGINAFISAVKAEEYNVKWKKNKKK